MESSLPVVKGLLAVAVFLAFVAWDVGKSWKIGDKWIQGSFLTLSAFTVQFLGYLNAQNVNLFAESKEKELQMQMLLKKQLSLDISRLVFCTFLGCVLPEVAFRGSDGKWSSLAAVAVSLCIHMSTEVYAVQTVEDPTFKNGRLMFISSSLLLLVAAISLVLYIGLAVINCKLARDRLSIKIPVMLSRETKCEMFHGNDGSLFKWWVIVRGCQQEFWLVSTALTPAVLVIVTTCVAFVLKKVISRPSLLHRGNDTLTWTLCLQCVFILTGWIILIWRWLIFLLVIISYGNRKSHSMWKYVWDTIGYEISFCRSVYLFILRTLNVRAVDIVPKSILQFLAFMIYLTVVLPKSLFIVVICLLMFFHLICWVLSILLAWVMMILLPCIFICAMLVIKGKPSKEVGISTETRETLYVTESSIHETRDSVMEKAYGKGQNSQKLLKVIKLSADESRKEIRNGLSNTENKYVYEHEGAWKMAAVAAISIIAELAYCSDSNETVKDTVQAYWEAQDLLEFLGFPDNITVNFMNLFDSGNSRAYRMSLEADVKMQEIESLVEMKGQGYAALKYNELAEVVRKLAEGEKTVDVKNKFSEYWKGLKPIDTYGEGTHELKQYSLQCVCKAISKVDYSNERELVDRAVRCLGDIIACGVLELQQVLPKYSRKWAEEFKEDNLIKALEMQEKFRAVMENWHSAEWAAARKAEDMERTEIVDLEVR